MPDKDPVIGATIVDVRPMTAQEIENEGWEVFAFRGAPLALVLSTGAILYASQDEEGNGPGAFFGLLKDKTAFAIA